ncbi:HNH endonuclease [Micromonospora taraxaci]|uniref:HNH endonuclease n=1 Tax=Micromonospora taraxaci TaxID=1316803 RepID=UPI0033C118C9
MCALCRRRPATTADHILPVSRGGTNDLANMRPACAACNYSRGNRMPKGPRPDPFKPTIH